MTQEIKMAEATEVAQAIPEPTIEELKASLAQMSQDIAQKEIALKSARDEAKAHQKFGQEKQAELKSQSDLRAEVKAIREEQANLREIAELQAIAIAQNRSGEDEESQQTLLKLKNIQQTQETNRIAANLKRQQETDALARQEYNQKADTIYAQAKTLFGEGEEEKLEDIEDLLKSGNISRAEQRIARAVKSKTPKTETPEETEEARVERLVKERMEAKYPGVYASDAGSPSGGSRGSPTEAMSLYIQGKITAEEATKRGVNFN